MWQSLHLSIMWRFPYWCLFMLQNDIASAITKNPDEIMEIFSIALWRLSNQLEAWFIPFAYPSPQSMSTWQKKPKFGVQVNYRWNLIPFFHSLKQKKSFNHLRFLELCKILIIFPTQDFLQFFQKLRRFWYKGFVKIPNFFQVSTARQPPKVLTTYWQLDNSAAKFSLFLALRKLGLILSLILWRRRVLWS